MSILNVNVEAFQTALLMLDKLSARQILEESVYSIGTVPSLESIVTNALQDIGEKWQEGSLALSQVYMSGKICEELIDELLPPGVPGRRNQPRTAIAVFEDYHMLGKRIVGSVVRSSGFELLDLGRLDLETLARRVVEEKVEILLLSVLMLPSALRIRAFKERIDREGIRLKLMVGGAPFRMDGNLWREVGADATGANAFEAVELMNRFAGEKS
jgi:methanogenic corrinoid protein MtbC1